ncbi:MAG: hypothetical protein H6696_09110 [Deferribacteres bacterium]|nr:hypothetical protein [candidate division KSB1 bacterium]MCB9502084.1 hypothetical protein [Deferribacteres bacterium]
MKRIKEEELIKFNGGADLVGCFGAGVMAGIAVINWWNPIGAIAFSGAVYAGAACVTG